MCADGEYFCEQYFCAFVFLRENCSSGRFFSTTAAPTTELTLTSKFVLGGPQLTDFPISSSMLSYVTYFFFNRAQSHKGRRGLHRVDSSKKVECSLRKKFHIGVM